MHICLLYQELDFSAGSASDLTLTWIKFNVMDMYLQEWQVSGIALPTLEYQLVRDDFSTNFKFFVELRCNVFHHQHRLRIRCLRYVWIVFSADNNAGIPSFITFEVNDTVAAFVATDVTGSNFTHVVTTAQFF